MCVLETRGIPSWVPLSGLSGSAKRVQGFTAGQARQWHPVRVR